MPDPWDSAEGQTHCIGDGCMPPHRAEGAAMTDTPPPTQDDLAAGRELDALVAEKVMGCAVERRERPVFGAFCRCVNELHWQSDLSAGIPKFSAFISAAWEVVEHMDSLGWKVQVRSDSQLEGYEADGPWVCVFNSRDGVPWAAADTAPLAICRAALKAISG